MLLTLFLAAYTIFLFVVCVVMTYAAFYVLKYRVPSIPTNKRIRENMIKLAGLTTNQNVYDLGCGMGHILITAHKLHPKNHYHGYDISKPAIYWARLKVKFLKQDINFYCADFFQQDLSNADVIFTYLWPSIMDRIYTEIWPSLKPGTKLISHGFPIKALKPVETVRVGKSKVLVYIR